jgi:CDP-glycerol glycerophosphotransferase
VTGSPLLSVIVAAHDLQGGLDSCLRSVLAQSFTDLEVVVVADPSPACRTDVAEAHRRGDARVSVVHLDATASIGRIRNAGAARARGEYLLFLDSDHLLWGGTLRAMADRLDACDRPDLLLFGHTRLHRGQSWPGAAAGLLAGDDGRPFTLAQRPDLLAAPAYSWDRLIRRGLWTRESLAFPDGLHEEVTAMHHALFTASRIAVLKWECVQIRRRHTQHPAGSPDGTPFDVFARYEDSFELLGRSGQSAAAPHLFTRMVRHYLFLLGLSGHLSTRERPRFFDRAGEHYQRFLPEGYERPPGREGVKFQLLSNGGYSAFQAARLPAMARALLPHS